MSQANPVSFLREVVFGGVRSIFVLDPTKEFAAANANRADFLKQIQRVVPDVRPETPTPAFAAEKLADVPPPMPQSGLTRFGDRAMPEFDLRPATVDPLDADPFGLDVANDNDALPAITRIRA